MKDDKDVKAGKQEKKRTNPIRRFGAWLELDIALPLKKPPHFGMRIVKTGVAVLAVFFFYLFINRPENGILLAMIAAIVSLQDTVHRSLRVGVLRMIGTALGGLIGIAFIWGTTSLGVADNLVAIALINSVGVVICIGLSAWLGFGEGAVISCVVFTAIFLNAAGDSPYLYALNRMVDTAIGIVVAVVVNSSIRRPKGRRPKRDES